MLFVRYSFFFLSIFRLNFHVNMDTIYDMDNIWELHMQQSSSWLYSWPTQFRRHFVFCQLTLKCKCWTIEAFVCSLFGIILFYFWWQKPYTLLCIYHLLLFRLLMIQWINLIQWKCQNVKKKIDCESEPLRTSTNTKGKSKEYMYSVHNKK